MLHTPAFCTSTYEHSHLVTNLQFLFKISPRQNWNCLHISWQYCTLCIILEIVKYSFPLVFSPEGTFSLFIVSSVYCVIWNVQDGIETCDYCTYGYCTFHQKLYLKTWKLQSLLTALQCHSHVYFFNFLIIYASTAGSKSILAKSQDTAANREHTLNE